MKVLVHIGILIVVASSVSSLLCYSCNTLSGDKHCTQDNFNKAFLKVVECPANEDVCVTLHDQKKGGIIRGCGKSGSQLSNAISESAFISQDGSCLSYIGNPSGNFPNSIINVCSCGKDYGNDKLSSCQ
jgi:hypothetical protein